MSSRRFLLTASVVTALAVAVPSALAAWNTNGVGTSAVKASSMPGGPTPSAPVTGSQSSASITVTWPAVNYVGTATNVAGYKVARYKGGVLDTIAGTCTGTIAGLTCADSVSTNGAYQYAITPVSGAWKGAEGTKSGTVTVTLATPPTIAITFPTTGSSLNAAGWQAGCGTASTDDFCGTATAGSGSITSVQYSVKRLSDNLYWSGAAFASASEVLANVSSGTTSWSVSPFASSRFTNGVQYTIRAVATNSNSLSTSASSSFTYDTTAPVGSDVNSTPNGTPNGLVDSGDALAVTYSEVMDPATIQAGWNGITTQSVTLNFAHCSGNGSPDCVTVSGVNLGSIALQGAFVANGNHSFSATANMTIATVSNKSVVTLTLTQSPSSNTAIDNNTFNIVWTPASSAKDLAGNASSTTPVTQSAAAHKVF